MIGAIVGVTEERVIATPCLHRTGALSGWDVAEQFRAVRLGMPIIYTSGNLVDRSRGVAGSLFFDKPYRPVAIIEACENWRDSRPRAGIGRPAACASKARRCEHRDCFRRS